MTKLKLSERQQVTVEPLNKYILPGECHII